MSEKRSLKDVIKSPTDLIYKYEATYKRPELSGFKSGFDAPSLLGMQPRSFNFNNLPGVGSLKQDDTEGVFDGNVSAMDTASHSGGSPLVAKAFDNVAMPFESYGIADDTVETHKFSFGADQIKSMYATTIGNLYEKFNAAALAGDDIQASGHNARYDDVFDSLSESLDSETAEIRDPEKLDKAVTQLVEAAMMESFEVDSMDKVSEELEAYANIMGKSYISGVNSMDRHPEMSQDERANLASAVSAYNVAYDMDSRKVKYDNSVGASEQEKGIMRNIASEYGLSEEDLRAEVNAVREETNACMDIVMNAGKNGITADDLEKHPGLRVIGSPGDTEADNVLVSRIEEFAMSDAGKEWLENFESNMSESLKSPENTNWSMIAYMKSAAPAFTNYVVNAEIEKANERAMDADMACGCEEPNAIFDNSGEAVGYFE